MLKITQQSEDEHTCFGELVATQCSVVKNSQFEGEIYLHFDDVCFAHRSEMKSSCMSKGLISERYLANTSVRSPRELHVLCIDTLITFKECYRIK